MQLFLQNATNKINYAASIAVSSTGAINKTKPAPSNAMCSAECH
jgi:hypothetical protein